MATFDKKALPKPEKKGERDLQPGAQAPVVPPVVAKDPEAIPVGRQEGGGSSSGQEAQGGGLGEKLGSEVGQGASQGVSPLDAEKKVEGAKAEKVSSASLRTEIDPTDLVEISPGQQVRLSDLFVPSRDFERVREAGFTRAEGRVFIVHGPEHAGKFTCAVALGLELCRGELDEPRLTCYQPRAGDRQSLVRLARSSGLEKGAVCILRDAFARNVAPDSLPSDLLEALNAALEERRAYLILTTENLPEHLEINVQRISAVLTSEQLDTVFEKHSRRYEELERVQVRRELISLARAQWINLKDVLQQPVQIDRFFYRLGELPGDASPEVLDDLARQVASLGRGSVLAWFSGLRSNEKLLALLIGILPGIRLNRLETFYARAVESLRKDGLTRLRDPRETGFEALLERVAATAAYSGQLADPAIDFRDVSYTDEIKRQVRSHHQLLWSLAPLFVELSEEAPDGAFSPLRRDLGSALAKAGWGRGSKLRELVEQLARRPSIRVVAVAGFALAEIYRLDRTAPAYLDRLLADWIRSGDRDLMWAVGVAAWQIGEAVAETEIEGEAKDGERAKEMRQCLFDRLRDLAEHPAAFSDELLAEAAEAGSDGAQWVVAAAMENLKSVCMALFEMAADSPAQTTVAIGSWLARGNAGDPRWTALCAASALFGAAVQNELARPLVTDLLPLVEPLLDADDKDRWAAAVMLRALLHRLPSPTEGPAIAASLMRLAGRCNDRVAANLTAGLALEWLTGDSAQGCRLGHALIARCAAMHGAAVSPAGLERGLVAAEAANGRRNWFGRAVQSVLDARLGASLVWLGSRRYEARPDVPVAVNLRVGPNGGRPPLLLPALEAGGAPPPAATVLLTSQSVLDLADGEGERWMAHLIRVVVGDRWDPRAGVPAMLVDPQEPGSALSAIAARIDADRARTLAQLDAAVWYRALEPHLGAPQDERPRIWERLAAWVEQLESATLDPGDEDLARRALAALLWLAAGDLPDTARRLAKWAAHDSPAARRALAVSAARLLFRVWRHREAPPIAVHRELFELAAAVVDSGWEGAVLILEAWREWLREPAWSELLLAAWNRDEGELEWARRLIAAHPKELEQLLRKWRGEGPIDRSGSRHEEPSSPEARFWSRLALRLAVASSGTIPDLAPGRSYVVLLLDSAVMDSDSHALVGKIGAGLIEGWRRAVAERRDDGLALLAYRLGERLPIALPDEQVEGEDLFASDRRRPPRLLSPVFETLPLERVERFLLLLAGGPVIDAADWQSTGCWERLKAFSLPQVAVPAELAQRLRAVAGNHAVDVILEAALAAPGA